MAAMALSAGMKERALSSIARVSRSTKARASMTAMTTAACTASPSWLTLAAFSAREAARRGIAGRDQGPIRR